MKNSNAAIYYCFVHPNLATTQVGGPDFRPVSTRSSSLIIIIIIMRRLCSTAWHSLLGLSNRNSDEMSGGTFGLFSVSDQVNRGVFVVPQLYNCPAIKQWNFIIALKLCINFWRKRKQLRLEIYIFSHKRMNFNQNPIIFCQFLYNCPLTTDFFYYYFCLPPVFVMTDIYTPLQVKECEWVCVSVQSSFL